MGENRTERQESQKRTDGGSENASREAQNERRNGNTTSAEQPDSAKKNLPGLKLTYGQTPDQSTKETDESSVSEVIRLGGGSSRRILIETSDGRTSSLDYDSAGKPVKYRDFEGRTYTNRGKLNGEDQPDVWVDEKNPVQPEGVNLEIDDKTDTVKLTDRATGIVRTTASNGLETNEYPGGGKTTHKSVDGVEFISIESKNGPLRAMKIENDRLIEYTDGEGTTFKPTDKIDPTTKKPLYSAEDCSGNTVEGTFTITADRTGNVVVRDESHPESSTYARRELNNGTVVTSTKADGDRKVVNAGVSLDPNSAEAIAAQESPVIADVPPGIDLSENARLANEHYTGGILFTSYGAVDWFYEQVSYGKPWDYKSPGLDRMSHPEYEQFGNWHYGYVGNAAGYSLRALQEEAGYAQLNESVSRPGWGKPGSGIPTYRFGGEAPYGDDPRDQELIRRGYEAYNQRLRELQMVA